MIGAFIFLPSEDTLQREREDWIKVLRADSRGDVAWYLDNYPGSRYAAAARKWLADHPLLSFAPGIGAGLTLVSVGGTLPGQWRTLHGSIQLAGVQHAASNFDIAYANVTDNLLAFYSSPDFKSKPLGTLETGDRIRVVEGPKMGDIWATVALGGKFVYVPGVKEARYTAKRPLTKTFEIPLEADAVQPEALAKLYEWVRGLANPAKSSVIVESAATHKDSEALARQVAFRRGLDIKLVFISAGFAKDSVSIDIKSARRSEADARDAARVTVLGPGSLVAAK